MINIKEFFQKNNNETFKKYIIILLIIYFLHHFSLWVLTIHSKDLTYQNALSNWDAAWYNSIINDGYNEKSIAFYPLYPFIIKVISILLPFQIPAQFIGTVFSSILFIIFNIFILKVINNRENHPKWLIPQTKYGYFFFLFAPSSYIFHSSHTESLYLLLSFLAFYYTNKNWILASALAGLCALTKNQGIFLSIAIAWMIINSQEKISDKIKKFILSGLISFSFYSIFLIYQYISFSNPFAFLDAQKHFSSLTLSFSGYFKSFFEIIKFKELSRFSIYESIYFHILFILNFLLFKKSKPVFFYSLFCILITPSVFSLMNAFRYTIFIFPLLFTVGDFLSKRNIIFLILLTIFLIYLNHQMTRNYVLSRWSY
ncbi:hypothetical protein [Silvanigrella sp.]|jgi:hypothetical protein|uniref:hypothetical protein n=1 Tax=Silvanigrella sp. TaxID=2024976 RepID=UPI0037CCAA4B